jgi:aryl-alcohol dehydrogenase-like predicted oxidoreductase
MRYRTLGRTNLSVSELGVGAWGLGGNQWQGVPDEECEDALRYALERGINFLDTASAYGDGHSERLIGKVIQAKQYPVIIATKVAPLNGIWPAPREARIEDVFPGRHVIASTERSLRNLGVDSIDLQQLHVWNPRWTDSDEWRRAFSELKHSGKVRFIGVSLTEHDPDVGIELVKSGFVDVIQVIYNIFDPSAAERLFPVANRHGVGIVARVPLDEGGLTGAIDETTKFEPNDFRAVYFRGDRKRALVSRLRALRRDISDQADLPEIAIRFCLSHPAVSTVIPGMRRRRHVESNVRAAALGALSDAMLTVLKRHTWRRNFYNEHID